MILYTVVGICFCHFNAVDVISFLDSKLASLTSESESSIARRQKWDPTYLDRLKVDHEIKLKNIVKTIGYIPSISYVAGR